MKTDNYLMKKTHKLTTKYLCGSEM